MNASEDAPAVKPKCLPCRVTLIVGLIFLPVLFGKVSTTVHKVLSGAGMDYCCAIAGVGFNYAGVLALLCGILVALAVLAVPQVREWRLHRDFERKYGIKIPASHSEPGRIAGSNSGPSFHGAEPRHDD